MFHFKQTKKSDMKDEMENSLHLGTVKYEIIPYFETTNLFKICLDVQILCLSVMWG